MSSPSTDKHPGTDRYVVLVLQGGGALGAYHVGAFRALREAGFTPDWVTGVSIGAINAAVIAGNPPDQQLSRLEEFWQLISDPALWDAFVPPELLRLYNTSSAVRALLLGQPNFSRPFFVNPYLAPPGTPPAMGIYDNSPLRTTLNRLADFDLINQQATRISLGVTQVRTGNVVYFDNTRDEHRPFSADHVLASSAIPPMYAGIRINGELYWDGGVVDNTPLDPVLDDQDEHPERDALVFMIDLWGNSAREPQTMDEVMWRYNQIQFASRTDRQLKEMVERQNLRRAISQMAQQGKLDSGLPALPDGTIYSYGNLDIVRITYEPRADQTSLSYVDFSHSSISQRIEDGYEDMQFALSSSPWLTSAAQRDATEAAPEQAARAAVHTVTRNQVQSSTPGRSE